VSAQLAIETTGLGKRFGSTWALRHCDLRIPEGTVTALVGPNGAGKTTLLHLLVGLTLATEGSATVLGWHPYQQATLLLPAIGFVGQNHPVEPGFSVSDMLTMGRKLNPGWDQSLAEHWIARHRISLDRTASKLSGGQQAQVALAMALGKQPRLLVLDEPVAALDPLARMEFMQSLMAAVSETGLTVLLSSHIIGDLERICDFVVLLAQGAVQLNASSDEVVSTHFRLVGPSAKAFTPRTDQRILSDSTAGRTRILVVRSATPLFDPEWQITPLSLEEIVLVYLSQDRTLELTA
jgi:ABC-2 type transport system ATP-binding protein